MSTPLASLASGQHGLVTRRQLFDLRLTDDVVDYAIQVGRLEVAHPGVYRVGGVPTSWEHELLAGILACGDGSAAGHRAAAGLHGLAGPFAGVREVVVLRPVKVRPAGFVVHRSTDLAPRHVTRVRGVPVTTPARTLVDLGAVVTQRLLDRAVDDALAKRLVTLDDLLLILGQVARRGRRGVGKLRTSLADRTAVPDSVLDAELERVLRRAGFEGLEVQFEVTDGGRLVARVDAAIPHLKIAIEADGAATRVGRRALEYDVMRQNALVALGWVVLRFTWRQVVGEPERLVTEVAAMVRRRTAELGLSSYQIGEERSQIR